MPDMRIFIISFYIASCVGLDMKFNSALKYKIPKSWIACFPVFYIYAFLVLLSSKRYNPFRLLRLFMSNFGVHAVMRSMLRSTNELQDLKKSPERAKHIVDEKRYRSSKNKKVVVTINRNIRNTFANT